MDYGGRGDPGPVFFLVNLATTQIYTRASEDRMAEVVARLCRCLPLLLGQPQPVDHPQVQPERADPLPKGGS